MARSLSYSILAILSLYSLSVRAQFDPPAGQPGSKAIHMDSSAIVAWATNCDFKRGFINFNDTALGKTTIGIERDAFGKANNFVISLGDGGTAVIKVDGYLFNGDGPDFAVFENAFLDNFLELAFVEVSSDGKHFVRFPAISKTKTQKQIEAFGSLDATKLYNFAGKYIQGFGVPFDLEEIKDSSAIDVDAITHIRIVDVVGNIDSTLMHSRDSKGTIVNDPWPTPFESSGFDLDAIGYINLRGNSIEGVPSQFPVSVYTAANTLVCTGGTEVFEVSIYNANGQMIESGELKNRYESQKLGPGLYMIQLVKGGDIYTYKSIIR